jgi:carbonic anhydrase
MATTSADRTLAALKAGNTRYKEGRSTAKHWQSIKSNRPQNPSAIVLSCSDSRVPVEIIFDQGLGELFVIRVAGNIAAPSQIASIEFAVTQFQTPIIIVLGHTDCAAINATVKRLSQKKEQSPDNLSAIVDRIAPSIASLVGPAPVEMNEALAHQCMQANVHASMNQLREGSKPILDRTTSGELAICGAFYDLETGKVSFLS